MYITVVLLLLAVFTHAQYNCTKVDSTELAKSYPQWNGTLVKKRVRHQVHTVIELPGPKFPAQPWNQYNRYTSPYEFAIPKHPSSWVADFDVFPKRLQDFKNQSSKPYADWFNETEWTLNSAWGPPFIPFGAPVQVQKNFLFNTNYSLTRMMTAASVLRGRVPYAHHHMFSWDVPTNWNCVPAAGAPITLGGFDSGLGIDCCDTSGYVYNYALGLALPTGIGEQAAVVTAPLYAPGGTLTGQITANKILQQTTVPPPSYSDLIANLAAGDLIFLRGDNNAQGENVYSCKIGNPISHVIMFLGTWAKDVNNRDEYLVFDSHGAILYDSNNITVPTGPQIRPFLAQERPSPYKAIAQTYYFTCFDHALRFL